uniref:Uncharacterized protein n=1 Tax=Parascaris equorum TaxID=6256 RepID=A0A914RXV2_PAREQ
MNAPNAVPRSLIPSMGTYGASASPSTFFGAQPTIDEAAHAQYVYIQQQMAAQQQQHRLMVRLSCGG